MKVFFVSLESRDSRETRQMFPEGAVIRCILHVERAYGALYILKDFICRRV